MIPMITPDGRPWEAESEADAMALQLSHGYRRAPNRAPYEPAKQPEQPADTGSTDQLTVTQERPAETAPSDATAAEQRTGDQAATPSVDSGAAPKPARRRGTSSPEE